MIVARHAKPAVDGLCYGRLDVPVEMDPKAAARCIERRWLRLHRPVVIWSSPSERCRAPAEALAARWGVPHEVDARLFELDFGEWEGSAWSSLAGEPAFERWARDFRNEAPPRGERLAELESRVGQWWRAERKTPGHLLIGHAGVIRALQVLIQNRTWEEALAEAIPYLQPFELEG